MKQLKKLSELEISGKRVFVRADLNVSLQNKQILNDFRLQAIVPTINYIIKNGGKVILASHLGRPNLEKTKDLGTTSLSTQILIPWFEKQGYALDFAADLAQAEQKSHHDLSKVLLIENLRFFKEEKEPTDAFAQQLAKLADFYINDAFGVMHRTDTSVTLLAHHFDRNHRGIGFLVEKEIETLTHLKNKPEQPFVLVLGGSKLNDKIPMIERFLQAPEPIRAHTILIGGLVAQAFLHAQGYIVGEATFDEQTITTAKKIIALAAQAQVSIMLPSDLRVISSEGSTTTHVYAVDQIPAQDIVVDIGPKTEAMFTPIIAQAKTIFANGTMGMYEHPAYAKGTRAVLDVIAEAKGYSVIGGGDITSAAERCGIAQDIDFCSTGGGATLAFLGAKNPFEELPGLRALLQ